MQQSTIKSLVDWAYGTLAVRPCSIEGNELDPMATAQVHTALVLWGVLLTEATGYRAEDIKPFLGRAYKLATSDLISFLAILDSARDALLHCDSSRLNAAISQFVPNIKIIFSAAVDGDPEEFLKCNCIFTFLRKLVLPRPDLDDQAVEDYLVQEQAAAAFEFPGSIEWAVDEMNKIIRRWFGNFHITDYRPHHGPGAVTEPGLHTVYAKYQAISNVPTVGRVLAKYGLGSLRSYVPTPFRWRISHASSTYVARHAVVPKTYKAGRSIVPQPVTLQWAQKGVQDALYKYIERHHYLSCVMPLTNQWQNAELARQGSRWEFFATLDLSHASDSVTLKHVTTLFRGTELLDWQIATRATHVRVRNETLLSSIFAGMGSSLCFPTETIIFAAACELVKRHGYAVSPLDNVYSVYGDDIIVPRQWAKPLIWLLTNLGFSINLEKSFVTGPFRESCGMEAFKGYDVTPLRYPFHTSPLPRTRKKRDGSLRKIYDVAVASAGCQFANRAMLEYGFVDLRFATLYVLQRYGYNGFVYTDALQLTATGSRTPFGCLTLYSNNPTNSHLPSRWNKRLQRKEYKGRTVYTSYNRKFGEECDELRLWEWLRRPPQEEVELDPYALLRASSTHLSRGWVGW